MAPRVEEIAPDLGGWTYVVGVAFAVLLYLACCCTRSRTPWRPRAFEMQVHSIKLHFLGGVTAIEGEADHALAGVRDRGGRARSRRWRSAQSPSSPSTSSTTGCCGSRWPRLPAPTCWSGAQPGPRAAARRRPGAPVGGVGTHQAADDGRRRRGMGRTARRGRGVLSAVHHAALTGYEPTCIDYLLGVHDRRVPLAGASQALVVEAPGPTAGDHRAEARPAARSVCLPTCRLAEAHPAGAGGQRRLDPGRHQPTAAPPGIVDEAAVRAHPRGPAAVGPVTVMSRGGSRTGCCCRPTWPASRCCGR